MILQTGSRLQKYWSKGYDKSSKLYILLTQVKLYLIRTSLATLCHHVQTPVSKKCPIRLDTDTVGQVEDEILRKVGQVSDSIAID